MKRELISLAIGNIRADHITFALSESPWTRPVHSYESRRRSRRSWRSRRAIVIAAAAALLAALAVTAYAAGLFRSLFSGFGEQHHVSEPDWYAQAEEHSEKKSETVRLEDLPGNAFTLSEAYYDGKALILAYSLDALRYPVQFGFGPGDEGFDELYTPGVGYGVVLPEEYSLPEDYTREQEIFSGSEAGGFIVREVYPGDHIRLTDGTDLGPPTEMGREGDQIILAWKETDMEIGSHDGPVHIHRSGLSEAAQGRTELELVFTVRDTLHYYYKDDQGQIWQHVRKLAEEEVVFTVPADGADKE